MRAAGRKNPTRRRGATTLESILVLLVLLVATLAALQLGLALVVKQAVSHAATLAAREAAKGADADELVVVVEQVLAGHCIWIGEEATLIREEGDLPVDVRGTLARTSPANLPLDALPLEEDEVRVTLCVSLAGPPFLNILKNYGLDFQGRTFTVSSLATHE